tara:strand:- start:222 stop:479 length:258 start_codon:yes stop_codon:yes gene_type:complete
MAFQKLQGNNAQAVTPGAATDIIQFKSNDTRGCVIYVGEEGDLQVVTVGGETVVFTAVPAGMILPVQVVQVVSTLTTADYILAIH